MPYKSKAQAAYFHIHKKELERQGVNVGEWDAASKGMSLPGKKAQGRRREQTQSDKVHAAYLARGHK